MSDADAKLTDCLNRLSNPDMIERFRGIKEVFTVVDDTCNTIKRVEANGVIVHSKMKRKTPTKNRLITYAGIRRFATATSNSCVKRALALAAVERKWTNDLRVRR